MLCAFKCSPILNRASSQQEKNSFSLDPSCPLYFETVNLCAELEMQETPIQIGKRTTMAKFHLWQNGTNGKVGVDPGHSVFVRLWMPMASGSHGSHKVKVIPEVDDNNHAIPGSYDFKLMNFTMAGRWEVYIQLRDEDGNTIDEVVQDVWI